MDEKEIKKALLMQLMKELTKQEVEGHKPTIIGIEAEGKMADHEMDPKDPMEDMMEGEAEDCAPEKGSKEERILKLKKLAIASKE